MRCVCLLYSLISPSFKIGLLKARSAEEKTQRQLLISDLYSQQRTAIHEENFAAAEEIKGRIALLLAAEEAERAARCAHKLCRYCMQNYSHAWLVVQG